jgi:hypothetical protein
MRKGIHHSTQSRQPEEQRHPLSPEAEKFLEENHIDFVDSGELEPEDTLKPMVAELDPNKKMDSETIYHMLEPHGQMAETLYNTETKYDEFIDMSASDAGGQEDQ